MKIKNTIVDIETTGGNATHSRITEIAIVIHDGEK
jgi:DNA polymerase-3 subunit epsilon